MNLSEFIFECQSKAVYSFSLAEAREAVEGSTVAIRRQLSRAVERGDIFSLRRGFYLILPPIYQNLGKLPLGFYVDKMFRTIEQRYYVSTLTASALHGASHQQIHIDFITTDKPLRKIGKGAYRLEFITATNWPAGNIITKQGQAGEYLLSDPALTIADLLHHQVSLGGLNRIVANIEELTEELNSSQLEELLGWYPFNATLQRMGFLLETIGVEDALTARLDECLQNRIIQTIPLFPASNRQNGVVSSRWKLRVNVDIENDLW